MEKITLAGAALAPLAPLREDALAIGALERFDSGRFARLFLRIASQPLQLAEPGAMRLDDPGGGAG